MSYGANEAVKDAEDEYLEDCADLIAQKAAELIAAGDMSREDAIDTAVSWLRQEDEAGRDETGVVGVECQEPLPSKQAHDKQVAAIKAELIEKVEEATTIIGQSD